MTEQEEKAWLEFIKHPAYFSNNDAAKVAASLDIARKYKILEFADEH